MVKRRTPNSSSIAQMVIDSASINVGGRVHKIEAQIAVFADNRSPYAGLMRYPCAIKYDRAIDLYAIA